MKYLKRFNSSDDYYSWGEKPTVVAKFPSFNELVSEWGGGEITSDNRDEFIKWAIENHGSDYHGSLCGEYMLGYLDESKNLKYSKLSNTSEISGKWITFSNDFNDSIIVYNDIPYLLKCDYTELKTITSIKSDLFYDLSDEELHSYLQTNGIDVPSDRIISFSLPDSFSNSDICRPYNGYDFAYITKSNEESPYSTICSGGKLLIGTNNGGEEFTLYTKALSDDNLHVALTTDNNEVHYSNQYLHFNIVTSNIYNIYDFEGNYLGTPGIDNIACPKNCIVSVTRKSPASSRSYLEGTPLYAIDKNGNYYYDGSYLLKEEDVPA